MQTIYFIFSFESQIHFRFNFLFCETQMALSLTKNLSDCFNMYYYFFLMQKKNMIDRLNYTFVINMVIKVSIILNLSKK